MGSGDVGHGLPCILRGVVSVPSYAIEVFAIFGVLMLPVPMHAVNNDFIDDEFLRTAFVVGFSFFVVVLRVGFPLVLEKDVIQLFRDQFFDTNGVSRISDGTETLVRKYWLPSAVDIRFWRVSWYQRLSSRELFRSWSLGTYTPVLSRLEPIGSQNDGWARQMFGLLSFRTIRTVVESVSMYWTS